MLVVDIGKRLPDFSLDISFRVDRDILVLFGPSGCGKTTTLRCIAGLTKPDRGRIAFGNEVFFAAAEKLFTPPQHRRIGYMFQDYALFPHMNVSGNIWYGAKKSDNKAAETYDSLLSILKIRHLAVRPVNRLSGGEKQRVALARALMANPQILLLDEPLSALDRTTRLELQAELKKMQRLWKIPFVLVTHDREEAEALGDRIVFMEKGREVFLNS
ncbi:MAG TPA: ATP-binding cassette domain-containing protein [Selenomonadales bacterium]|nr:ATP-binding cassette domain-containing protein [Selenomonadales bacterium]